MVAICILGPNDIEHLAFLAEQVFLCLFQTYRSFLFNETEDRTSNRTSGRDIMAIQSAHYFMEVFKRVFGQTGWPGGILRANFEGFRGANVSSPLYEWSSQQLVSFVRTDTRIKDPSSGNSIPVATLRWAKPRTMTKGTDRGNRAEHILWRKPISGKLQHELSYSDDHDDASKGPLPGMPYFVVFEAYTDGSPHPYAYSRLSAIGPFINWDQARSFAVRVEWEYPVSSGKWLCRYLQQSTQSLYEYVDLNTPGALKPYAYAISLLQWLFDAPPNHSYNWIPRVPGSAHVVQVLYNLHEQAVTIKASAERVVMISGARKSMDTMVKQLKDPRLGLENVGSGVIPMKGNRKKCDVCQLLSDKAVAHDGFNGGCKRVGNSNVCLVCQNLGRPCCTWTENKGIRNFRLFTAQQIAGETTHPDTVSAEEITHWKIVYPALINQFEWTSIDSVQSYRNKLVLMQTTERDQEDATDLPIPNADEGN